MPLECPLCHESKHKLKVASCGHAFCFSCLDTSREGNNIMCSQCGKETPIPPFGIKDLESKFSGVLKCVSCEEESGLPDMSWCVNCDEAVCIVCTPKHKEHKIDPAVLKQSASYIMGSLDQFSALHTDLTQIQKKIVGEYCQKLEQVICSKMDDDMANRLKRFKDQKRWIEETYDVKDAPRNEAPLRSIRFIEIFSQLSHVVPSPGRFAEPLPKEGPIFKSIKMDELIEQMLTRDRFSTFSPDFSFRSLGGNISVNRYIGSGIIGNPSDICVVPERNMLFVSCRSQGLYRFNTTGECSLKDRVPVPEAQSQLSCMDHIQGSSIGFITTLDGFCQWTLTICNIENLETQKRIPIPNEPAIAKSWYRWVKLISDNTAVISTGDEKIGAVWLCDIPTQSWTLILEEAKATYRRAAVRILKNGYTIYVPDMQNQKIVTLDVDKETLQVKDKSTLDIPDLKTDLPTCIDCEDNQLVVGFWKTGKIVLVDLSKEGSSIICCVGERELLSIRKNGKQLYVLCKQKELVEMYSI